MSLLLRLPVIKSLKMNFFQRRKILKKANLLDMTPYRLLEHEIEEGKVNILQPRFNSRFWKPRLQPLLAPNKKFIRIKLDEIGSEIWLLIDSNRKVGDIIRILREKFGENVEPADERVGKFLSMMYEQRYISFNELKN